MLVQSSLGILKPVRCSLLPFVGSKSSCVRAAGMLSQGPIPSMFALTTQMVEKSFSSSVAQVTYGVVISAVTAANVVLYRLIANDNPGSGIDGHILGSSWRIMAGIACKAVGIICSATVFAPAMSTAVIVTLVFLVIPPQLAE